MDLAAPQFLHNPKASVSTVGYGDDRGVHAQFDDEFVKNDFKSDREGRAVYDHFYSVELLWPGDNTKSYKYRFSKEEGERGNEWTERFSRQWAAFQNSTQQSPDGTPIEMWPPLDKKRVFEFKANKIYTVEQIASMSDATGPSLGLDWRKIRDMAVAFLNPETSMVKLSQLSRENEDLRHEMEALRQLVAGREVPEEPKKKRGPKPKIVTEAA